MNKTVSISASTEIIKLTGNNLIAFKKSIKTGFYKSLLNEGIISHDEFNKLMEILSKK